MKNSLVAIIVSLVLVAGASLCSAQQEKGDSEIITNANFSKTFGDFSYGALQLTGVYGYFYTKKSEFIGGLVGVVSFAGGTTDASLGGLFGYRYNFEPRNKLVPYVGGDVFFFDFSPPEGVGIGDVTYFDGQGGVKYYVNRNLAFDLNVSLGFGPSDVASTALNVRFGIAYIFSRR